LNTENEHDYFNVAVKLDTPGTVKGTGAYLVTLKSGAEHWVPKALCELKERSGPFHGVLEVEHWFAEKEGMNE
jgi:hypothetical protein